MMVDVTIANLGYACQLEVRLVDFMQKSNQHQVRDIPLIYCPELSGSAH